MRLATTTNNASNIKEQSQTNNTSDNNEDSQRAVTDEQCK